MKKFSILICFLFLIIALTSCGNDCIKHYIFEVPSEVSPKDSILHIGDTLHFKMISDNQSLKDIHGNRIVQFPNFDPNAIFQLPLIDSFPVQEGFLLNELIVDTSIYDTQLLNTDHLGIGLFFFGIPKDEFESRIEFKVVLNTPGTYMLVCSDFLWASDEKVEREFPDRCGHNGELRVTYSITQGSHESILSDYQHEVLDMYWKYSAGDKAWSDKYYFKVVE